MSGPDRIELRGLRVVARHGLLDEERERPQPFEIDLELELDLSEAGRSDDLGRTVDYGSVVRRVVSLASERQYGLLEALAEAIAGDVLAETRCDAVSVRVTKLRPPVPADLAAVSVAVRRSRA